ncbi:hypothetical protein HMPREF1979_02936 [Actinomyces johnsonii F0542]|uniref:Uncharacterized protein n=1 Tax=Actinomyces johnsonii F0542 TaxID=1321818 RepID=U1RUH5_9ACTO|nr:hypothetical protein HMPREF1979_02936 [Actinomyces johnsonii F0542]
MPAAPLRSSHGRRGNRLGGRLHDRRHDDPGGLAHCIDRPHRLRPDGHGPGAHRYDSAQLIRT